MKSAGCFLVVVALIVAVVLAMLWSALAIGAANAWFFAANFSDGWNLAWSKPWVLLGWAVLFVGGVGGSQRSTR